MARLIFLLLLALPVASHAASFDCTKAKSLVEITICHDPELSRMDSELGRIYQNAKNSSQDKKAFQAATQAAWKRREKDCKTRECIFNWYVERKATLLAGIQSSNFSYKNCLSYGPQVVVSGQLARKTFPGRPNYESVAKGDEPETGFYLTLDNPVCTIGDSDNATTAPLKNVRQVQLLLDESTYTMLRPLISKHLKLRGQLISGHTGHHHAPLLLDDVSLLSVTGR